MVKCPKFQDFLKNPYLSPYIFLNVASMENTTSEKEHCQIVFKDIVLTCQKSGIKKMNLSIFPLQASFLLP